jgi:hypothetical protein
MLAPERKAVLILGMHRSGTSALAHVVNLLGAVGPKDLMPPSEFNVRGYMESINLVAANECLLASAGSCWHDHHRLDPDHMDTAAKRHGHRDRIKEVIIREFGDAPLFVLKDPRMCRFVPLLLSILTELNVRPLAFVPVRNPLEVARSLQQRDGLTQARSLLLWLRHVLDAEYYSRSIQRFFLRFEDLLLDWRTCLGRATEGTGLAWPRWSSVSGSEIDQFLIADLRRQHASAEQLRASPEVGSWMKDTYAIVSSLSERGGCRLDFDRLDLIRTKFDEACEVIGPALKEEEALTASVQRALVARATESEALRLEVQQRAAESEALRLEVQQLATQISRLEANLTASTAKSKALRRKLQTARSSWRPGKYLHALGVEFRRAATFLRRG